jgi:Major Facilitator Superfamily
VQTDVAEACLVILAASRYRTIPADRRPRWGALVWFSASDLSVALPTIAKEFRASLTTLQWANIAFTVVTGSLVIAGGRLGDLLGRRCMLVTGTVVFAVASVVAAGAPNPAVLIIGRAVIRRPADPDHRLALDLLGQPPHRRGDAAGGPGRPAASATRSCSPCSQPRSSSECCSCWSSGGSPTRCRHLHQAVRDEHGRGSGAGRRPLRPADHHPARRPGRLQAGPADPVQPVPRRA